MEPAAPIAAPTQIWSAQDGSMRGGDDAVPSLNPALDDVRFCPRCAAEAQVAFPRELSVDAADAPWVLVEEPGLRERLAPHGVLVRDCTSFGLAGTARVAVPDEAGLERLETALRRASRPVPTCSGPGVW